MGKETKEESDLDVKIGTKDEAFWTDIQQKCSVMIERLESELKLQKAILFMCEDKIAFEKDK